jgi:hypothetical protein
MVLTHQQWVTQAVYTDRGSMKTISLDFIHPIGDLKARDVILSKTYMTLTVLIPKEVIVINMIQTTRKENRGG